MCGLLLPPQSPWAHGMPFACMLKPLRGSGCARGASAGPARGWAEARALSAVAGRKALCIAVAAAATAVPIAGGMMVRGGEKLGRVPTHVNGCKRGSASAALPGSWRRPHSLHHAQGRMAMHARLLHATHLRRGVRMAARDRGAAHVDRCVHECEEAEGVVTWAGLAEWRRACGGVDERTYWGRQGPEQPSEEADGCGGGSGSEERAGKSCECNSLPCSLVDAAVQVLKTASPDSKARLTHSVWRAYINGQIPLHPPGSPVACMAGCDAVPPAHERAAARPASAPAAAGYLASAGAVRSGGLASAECYPGSEGQQRDGHKKPLPDRPSRPERPVLVAPKQVPSYSADGPIPLSAHLLHNLAHIELNAVDLAWDTLARFAHLRLPDAFYEDFARVADDESRHLGWCLQRLSELGHAYGDMPAHDLLWQGAQASAHDVIARLAVVPLGQEARGLDAGARLTSRLRGAGDTRSAAIVERIAQEVQELGFGWREGSRRGEGVEGGRKLETCALPPLRTRLRRRCRSQGWVARAGRKRV